MTLLAPLFLLGLLGALLPWWLHRLSASNPPQHDFGSTRFLETNQSTSSKKRRTKYWLLLALRMLFLALLSLLFAQPVIERLRAAGNGDVRHILLIDTSLSQSLGDRWQRTQDAAQDILAAAAAGDEAVIISASDRFVELESDKSIASAQSLINSIEPGQSRLDYGRMAAAVAASVSDNNNHLHVITDVQASSLPERFTDLAVDKIQQITVHTTASDSDTNVAVTAKLEQVKDTLATVVAIVSNYGEATSTTLTAAANDNTLASVELDIPANGSQVHRFTQLNLAEAGNQLEITLRGTDSLTVDDSWLVPLPASDKTDITVLVGDTERTVSSTYVKAAIESDNRFQARLVEVNRFTANDAGNLVIVPDASALSDRTANRLNDYVRDGGNVLIAVGSKPHSAQTNSLIGLGLSNQNNPAPVANPVGNIDTAHQVTSELETNWRSVSVIRHASIQNNITDRKIIELSDGSPLLVEKRPGSGRLLLLTTALDTSWTDLPTTSVFVAFIIKSINYLGGDTTTALYRSTGDVIPVASGQQLIDPGGKSLRDLSEISERATFRLEQPGIYQLRNSAGTQAIAVNSDPRESDITQIDTDTINNWQQMTSNSTVNNSATPQSAANNHKSFWLWLLPLLLCIALAESLYSHRHLWIRREA